MEKEYRILITNGGSTSTKIAVRENHEVDVYKRQHGSTSWS